MHRVFDKLNLNLIELASVSNLVKKEKSVEALESLLSYYRERTDVNSFFLFNTNSFNDIEKQLNELSESEKKHILKVANDIKQKTFLFEEPWDMERTQEPYTFQSKIDWLTIPDNDPEWMYMLNRQNYLNILAQAYLLTKEKSIGEEYCHLMEEWLIKNPDPRLLKKTTCRTIDTGIRLRNWVKSLEIMIHYPNFPPELLAELLVTVFDHLEFLAEDWYLGRYQTNWIILESNGAFLSTVFFRELKNANKIREQSLDILVTCGAFQMTKEGMHWEQSFQYHNEVLLKLAEVYLLCERNGINFPPSLHETVLKMATVTAQICKPNHHQSNFGDSDRESLMGLLLFLEQVLKIPLIQKKKRTVVDRFVLCHFGKDLFLEENPTFQKDSVALVEAGIYLMKDEENDVHSMFTCGPLGHGHGHDNLLHFELFAHGEDILIDSGRYNYEESKHQRLSFKAGEAHNTIIVDEMPYQTHQDPWTTQTVAQPINMSHYFSEKVDFVEGGHLGYLKLKNSLYVNRKIIFIKPDLFIIIDDFFGKGEHKIQQFYHFEKNEVTVISDQLLNYQLSNNKNIQIQVESSSDLGFWKSEKVYVSNDYNEKHLTTRMCFESTIMANSSIVTFIQLAKEKRQIKRIPVKHEYGSEREFNNVSAFDLGNNQKILINHMEDQDSRRAYIVDDKHVYGLVVLWDKEENVYKIK